MSKLIETEVGWVYLIAPITNPTYCKIGRVNPTKDLISRLNKRGKSIQTGCPDKLGFYGLIHGDSEVEKWLHEKFNHISKSGEWFEFSEYSNIAYVFAQNGWYKLHSLRNDFRNFNWFIHWENPITFEDFINDDYNVDKVVYVDEDNYLSTLLLSECSEYDDWDEDYGWCEPWETIEFGGRTLTHNRGEYVDEIDLIRG